MSSGDADTNSVDNDYGQYDDLEAALVIAAADADARSHVHLEEEQEENGVKQDYHQESLGYYQNDEPKSEKEEQTRKAIKRKLSEEVDEESSPGRVFFVQR